MVIKLNGNPIRYGLYICLGHILYYSIVILIIYKMMDEIHFENDVEYTMKLSTYLR